MIVNPTAGPTNARRKAQTLQAVKAILGDCEIHGLDTQSREEFMQCAADLARQVEVHVVAGGDGSFSDAVNALDSDTVLSYLPLGSGCALGHALGLPPQLTRAAKRIVSWILKRQWHLDEQGRRRVKARLLKPL